MRSLPILTASLVVGLLFGGDARAHGKPNGASLLRVLGPRAERALASRSGRIGALVAIPRGMTAAALGIEEVAPGIGRTGGSAATLRAFAAAHPGVYFEIPPPLHTLLDTARGLTHSASAPEISGVDGRGVLVGVADTGLDVTHADFLDENGRSRVAWILDLSVKPIGLHPDLENQFGTRDVNGVLVAGAVLTGDDIDALRLLPGARLPGDDVGHGTHVTSIAAGKDPSRRYLGMAPGAKLVIARVVGPNAGSLDNDDLLRGVAFLFHVADDLKLPIVVNLALGTDFGPHDGTMLWEQVLASFVGPDHPGHALVVAAGNSGSIAETPTHQSVHVTRGDRVRVPIVVPAPVSDGGVKVWVTIRDGAAVSVGLDGPRGRWIAPVAPGSEQHTNMAGYNAGVINGSGPASSPVPMDSNGAIVVWEGAFDGGTYAVTLEGEGTAELYVEASGSTSTPMGGVGFATGVREGTINLPGTHPSIIAVGCTVNKRGWTSRGGGRVEPEVPLLDAAGGYVLQGHRLLRDGEVCWFSSAGPNAKGVRKPEIVAPGGVVVAAMSGQALPGSPASVFTSASCPALDGKDTPDPTCLQVDSTHAVALGTSMSAPMVAGIIALLFQRDATLTQDRIVLLLQAGAHRIRGDSPFDDQAGPGEVDALGSLEALELLGNPGNDRLPSRDTSWMTLGSEYAHADGVELVTAIVELRTADPDDPHRAIFDSSRLAAYALVNGRAIDPPALTRRAPGLYYLTARVPRGRSGSSLTLGVTFDGADVVQARTIPIATDVWAARYPSVGEAGGCGTVGAPVDVGAPAAAPLALLMLLQARARRARRAHSPSIPSV